MDANEDIEVIQIVKWIEVNQHFFSIRTRSPLVDVINVTSVNAAPAHLTGPFGSQDTEHNLMPFFLLAFQSEHLVSWAHFVWLDWLCDFIFHQSWRVLEKYTNDQV